MNKTIKLFAILILALFAFFSGVLYSDSIKEHAGWIFEKKEEEVELPDLSEEPISQEESIQEIDNSQPAIEEDSQAIDDSSASQAQ